MNILVFDIETIPDVETGRRLYGQPAEMEKLTDEEVARIMLRQRVQESGGKSEMLRCHLQKIVAISAILRVGDRLRIDSLGTVESSEIDIIKQFFKTIQHYTPTLVSWNGSGFDLPVLHYRSLKHKIPAERYWNIKADFRFNNYLNRYHERHIDVMDMLAAYQPRAFASLDDISILLGLPGKLNMSGGKVWDNYLQEGGLEKIRDYCEIDVLNTYLIFLQFELIRGHLNSIQYEQECQKLRELLTTKNKSHFQTFLEHWQN
ncbi:MAG: 3'-5' exonuclease [Thiomargarita sp.]|nr:3'-5' exonuclease [Thiomargarita sp.]